jgi:hypothetical protein
MDESDFFSDSSDSGSDFSDPGSDDGFSDLRKKATRKRGLENQWKRVYLIGALGRLVLYPKVPYFFVKRSPSPSTTAVVQASSSI